MGMVIEIVAKDSWTNVANSHPSRLPSPTGLAPPNGGRTPIMQYMSPTGCTMLSRMSHSESSLDNVEQDKSQ